MESPTDAEILSRPLSFINRPYQEEEKIVFRCAQRSRPMLILSSSLFFLKYGTVVLATTYVCAHDKLFPMAVLFGLTASSIVTSAGFVDLFVFFFRR
jgi:hypothetical protein